MAEDVRQLVMSAQNAERAGDLALAQLLLERAALACEASGRTRRGEQLRRQAKRVSETLPGDRSRTLFERVPSLADPGQAAWCSFCCRPSVEVGALVAGPAGAFICQGCTEFAATLLAGRPQDAE